MTGHTLFDKADLNPFRFTEPADAYATEGYIYVFSLSSGVTKVGYSSRIKNRMTTHFTTAAIHATTIDALWISMPHANAQDNETALKAHCRKVAKSQFGAEYFVGLPFADAVAKAESLAFKRATPRPKIVFSLEEVAAEIGVDWAALERDCYARRLTHIHRGRGNRGMTREHIDKLLAELTDPEAPERRRRAGLSRLSTRLLPTSTP